MTRATRATTSVRFGARWSLAAVLVLGVAACAEDDDGPDLPSAEPSDQLTIEAGDLYFEPEQLAALAGEVAITLQNVGAVDHDVVIEEVGDVEVAYAAAGSTASGTVTLEPGTYTFYCSIPGHRNAMEGTLVVS